MIDPMAGGGVVADTCLAFNRRCWSFDMVDRPDERPEIEPYFWDIKNLKWPITGKTKPDLIIFDLHISAKRQRNMKKRAYRTSHGKNTWIFLKGFSGWHLRTVKKGQGLL